MSANMVKPGKNGYKICFATDTVVMNYKFAAAAGKIGTTEYKIMKQIREDFPDMSEVVVSGRQQKSPRPNKRLTYENMETHIGVYENAEEPAGSVQECQGSVQGRYQPLQVCVRLVCGSVPGLQENSDLQGWKIDRSAY